METPENKTVARAMKVLTSHAITMHVSHGVGGDSLETATMILLQLLYGCTDAFLALTMQSADGTYLNRAAMDPTKYVWAFLARFWVYPGTTMPAVDVHHLVHPIYALCGEDEKCPCPYSQTLMAVDKRRILGHLRSSTTEPATTPKLVVDMDPATGVWHVKGKDTHTHTHTHTTIHAAYSCAEELLKDDTDDTASAMFVLTHAVRKYHEHVHAQAKYAGALGLARLFVGGGDDATCSSDNPLLQALLEARCKKALTSAQRAQVAALFDTWCKDVPVQKPDDSDKQLGSFRAAIAAHPNLGQPVVTVLRGAGFRI